MSDPKQVIVVRKDLNMRRGKECAQAAHASMKVFFDRMRQETYEHAGSSEGVRWVCDMTPEMETWKQGIFTKIVVSCNSLAELLKLQRQAEDAGIPCAVIEDCGRTEFDNVKTVTCLAVGPASPEKVDAITGHLPLR